MPLGRTSKHHRVASDAHEKAVPGADCDLKERIKGVPVQNSAVEIALVNVVKDSKPRFIYGLAAVRRR